MKAYTNLKQSKKLAEILPIESADMYYPYFGDNKWGETARFGKALEYSGEKDIPCWSLEALLSLIKDECGYFEFVYLKRTSDGRANPLEDVYRLSTYVYDVYKKELVDACVTMIEKLYKQKLL